MTSAGNGVRDRWHQGETAVVAWAQIASPLVAETLAAAGFDAVVVDLQHSLTNIETAAAMFAAIEARGSEPFARPLSQNPEAIGQLLDAGASGVIVPMVNSAQQAREVVQAAHYPPAGHRSFGPRRPPLRYGSDYAKRTTEIIVTLAMIETREALAELGAILSVEGLDGVFVGPSDLALSLGYGLCEDMSQGEYGAAIAAVARAARAAGKHAGIYCPSHRLAGRMRDQGFDLVVAATDLSAVGTEARNAVDAMLGNNVAG